MPIRTRTHEPSPYFQTDEAIKENTQEAQPVSIGSATKPVDWRRTARSERTPLARPKASSQVGTPRKKTAPVVDASDNFLGVFLPRPSVNLTRSSYSDIRPSDVKATEDFKRPSSSRSHASDKHRTRTATELYKDGLAPDFEPIELVSVELLFNPPAAEQEVESSAQPISPAPPSTADAGSIAPSSEIGLTEDRPVTPTTPKQRRSFSFSSRLSAFSSSQAPTSPNFGSPSRRSIFGGKSKHLSAAPPLPRSPSPVPSSRLDADTTLTKDTSAVGEELLPPQPAFLRESTSRKSFSASSRRGSDAASTVDQVPRSPQSVRTQTASPLPQAKAAPQTTSSSFKPKMTTILSRFSSRQMGDHKCRRGYPIAVFAGAQSLDVGSITNSQVEGAYSLFFGPGHPQNVQELMSDSERKPSHLQNPKPPSTAATARRAELIATTRALQAIHDLYQGKACAHVCMDSAYVAKAWGSWIPKWEEEGWPGDEHVTRRKDSGYRGSGSVSEVDEPIKRSSKRLADEDLLRQLAAIRRLYARAERKGTGAAHLYLIDKNVNPAHKSARQILDNTKVMAAASPPQSPMSMSRRESMTASRASMSHDGAALGVPRHRRQRSVLSSTGSQRHSKRGSVDIGSDAGASVRERGSRSGRHRSGSALKAAPALQEETPSEVAAPSAVEEGTVLLERRPSVKSAASAVTALDEDEGAAPVAAATAPAAAPEESSVKADEADKPDGVLAAAAASAGAFLAGVAGYGASKRSSPSPPNEKAVPDAAVPEETVADIKEGGDAAVPEEPVVVEASEGLAPPLKLAEVTPAANEEGELTAVEPMNGSPIKRRSAAKEVPIVAPLKTKKSAKAVRASTTKEAKAADKEASTGVLDRSKSVDKVSTAPARSASGGRLINYSRREKKGLSNGSLGAAAIAAPVASATETASTLPEDEEPAVNGAGGAPLASVVEDAGTEAAPSQSAYTDVAAPSATSVSAAPAVSPTAIKKRSSMPAVRQSMDDRQSVRSTTSKTRRFRTLSFLGGRKAGAEELGLAPEEEDWAVAAEKDAMKRKSSLFRKGNKKAANGAAAPPLPDQFREKIAMQSGAASPIEEIPSARQVNGREENKAKNRSVSRLSRMREPNGEDAAAKRKSAAVRAAETSAFDDEDDEEEAARAVPSSATRGGFLSRGKKQEKTPKPPKPAKEPKEPKEPFSFKKKMSHLMTME